MVKRNEEQILKDVTKIREAAKTATSFKELKIATGLSYSEIKTSMSRRPTIFKRLREQLMKNKAQQMNKVTEKKTETSFHILY